MADIQYKILCKNDTSCDPYDTLTLLVPNKKFWHLCWKYMADFISIRT